jgi:hypothetical protein
MFRKTIATLLAAGCIGIASSGWAANPAVVTGVQMPAWLERNGLLSPLAPGAVLERSDAVRTGRNARVQISLPEGSTVKLGENALLKLTALERKEEASGVFRATLEVLRGAFRFTTDRLAAFRNRDVRIRVASVTAGVRGTDLWGKAAEDRDIVCLIEGRIEVQHLDKPALAMKDPLTFFIAPRNAEPQPVSSVPLDKLREWAQETNIAEGKGALQAQGAWGVTIVHGATQDDALDAYQRLRRGGYAAELMARKERAGRVYDVRIGQLPTEADAQALASQLGAEFGFQDLKVAGR